MMIMNEGGLDYRSRGCVFKSWQRVTYTFSMVSGLDFYFSVILDS